MRRHDVPQRQQDNEGLEEGHIPREVYRHLWLLEGAFFQEDATRSRHSAVCRLIFVTACLVSTLANAQNAQVAPTSPDLRDGMTARNHAMGGAFEALGYGTEVILGNPAAMSLYKRYQIEASGAWDPDKGFGFASVALADSTPALAAGISYQFTTYGETERRWGHFTSLALAFPVAQFLHLGVTARYDVLLGATNTNTVTMNAGLILRPFEFLTVGFSGHNLIPSYNRDIPLYCVVSIAGQFKRQFSPAFDLWLDFSEPQVRLSYRGGIEWLVAEKLPLRFGYQWDDIVKRQYISVGIGWFVRGSGIDFAYRHEIEGEGKLLSLTLKLQV